MREVTARRRNITGNMWSLSWKLQTKVLIILETTDAKCGAKKKIACPLTISEFKYTKRWKIFCLALDTLLLKD